MVTGETRPTPGPVSWTTPTASWPSAIGNGRTRSPLTTERSEWQSEAAAIRTSTSPSRGAPSSSSSTSTGRVPE